MSKKEKEPVKTLHELIVLNPTLKASLIQFESAKTQLDAVAKQCMLIKVTDSDSSVVAGNFDPSTNSGVAHFGKSGVASLNAVVKNAKGDILGSGAADFTVTTGDPAAVSDVKIAFSGLSEEPPVEG